MQLYATITPTRKIKGILSAKVKLLGKAYLSPNTNNVDSEWGLPKQACIVMFSPPLLKSTVGYAIHSEIEETIDRTLLKDSEGYVLKDSDGYILTL